MGTCEAAAIARPATFAYLERSERLIGPETDSCARGGGDWECSVVVAVVVAAFVVAVVVFVIFAAAAAVVVACDEDE